MARFYEIDLLRFLSAFFVVVFHYTYTGYMEGFAPIADFPVLREYTRYAYMGINFFFVISGFVIFMSIESASSKKFLASRFTRLFPAYWTALLITTVTILLIGDDKFSISIPQFIANLTMVNTLFGQNPIESAYWTLFIELQFYLLVFVVLLFNGLKHFIHVLAGILIVSTVALYFPWARDTNMWIGIFPHWSGYFAAGGIFYLIKRDGINFYCMLLWALAFIYIIKQSTLFGELMQSWFKVEFNIWIIALINALFFAIMSITAFCKNNPLRQPIFYYLGILTYPLYLIHQQIGYMLFNRFGTPENISLLVILTSLTMFLVAYLINKYAEVKLSPYFKSFANQLLKVKKPELSSLSNKPL